MVPKRAGGRSHHSVCLSLQIRALCLWYAVKMLQRVWSLYFCYVGVWPRCARKTTQSTIKLVKGRHSGKKKSRSEEFSIMITKSSKKQNLLKPGRNSWFRNAAKAGTPGQVFCPDTSCWTHSPFLQRSRELEQHSWDAIHGGMCERVMTLCVTFCVRPGCVSLGMTQSKWQIPYNSGFVEG